MKKKLWIQTYSGLRFDYSNIKGNRIVIEDIAHSLSNIARFTGHTDFYSVAQHSIYVSQNVPPEDALWGLLHDASEAYAGDVNKPLKNKLGDSYRDIEGKIHRLVAKTFKLKGSIPMSVHLADLRLLLTEKRDLFRDQIPWDGYVGLEPFAFKIKPWSPKVAKKKFLEKFKYLY
jgi:5'-deoxynucleotidase YfbR-like HD superfamily hydrolase